MRNSSSGARLGLLLASLLLGTQALADQPTVYRWVDKDGHVHYDDSGQAPGSKAVNPRVMSDDSAATPPPSIVAKQSECKAKADDYNRYKAAGAISETDALGNTHTYSAEDKDKLVERKRQDLVALCGASAADAPAAAAPAAPAATQQ